MATPKKIVTPKKMIKKEMATPKIFGVLYCEGGLLLIFGKMAYFILYWFINAI